MQHRTWAGLVGLVALLGAQGDARDREPGPPADFKLVVLAFEAGNRPVEKDELVVHRGRVYQFRSSVQEVVIYEPALRRLDVLSLDRRDQTSITLRKLDEAMQSLRKVIGASIAKLEKEGGRGNRLLAQMSRDLIEPELTPTFDAQKHHLTLKGRSAQADATGEPDPDAARLALIGDVLPALVKLEAMRDIREIPPFTELETIAALVSERKLRPTELSFLYRQAGPPQRYRWTYELVPSLTDREREALARVEYLRLRATTLPFDKYEQQHRK